MLALQKQQGAAAFVKLVELSESATSISFKYLSYEEYTERYRERDSRPDVDKFGDPEYVYTTYNDEIGLTPIPDTSNRSLKFDYYVASSALSAATDTSIIPERFEPLSMLVQNTTPTCSVLTPRLLSLL